MRSRIGSAQRTALALLLGGLLAGCAQTPPRYASTPAAPAPSTRVYFYPLRGQSPTQQDRDKYECYLWAKQETGFDPADPRVPSIRRVEVVPSPPPGSDAVAGAVAGAVIGAIAGSPRHAGEGVAVGATVGAIAGAASDNARAAEAEAAQARYDRRNRAAYAYREEQASAYRRAMSACLEGRGYSVR